MLLRIKKLDKRAAIPAYSKAGDAGLDLVATSITKTDSYWEYGTGLAMEIPQGAVGLLFPRSSISNTPHSLRNSVGVIDSGYRGEVKVRMSLPIGPSKGESYKVGDRICQLIVMEYPFLQIIEAEEIGDSSRGSGGFGSTGS
jgi:dUTP pyrophosphatase